MDETQYCDCQVCDCFNEQQADNEICIHCEDGAHVEDVDYLED